MESRRPPADRVPPPMNEDDIARLQALLDAVPAPLEPLDAVMVDGYLCGVLLQPQPVAEADWLATALDARDDEGPGGDRPRPLPAGFDAAPLVGLLRRRHGELDRAIARREWFDPWVFELDEDETGDEGDEVRAVFPWVAGFAFATTCFPGLLAIDDAALLEPLALVFRHLDPADLEDADALLAEIDTLEPPADLTAAVEELVRATLLLADVSRPRGAGPAARHGSAPPALAPRSRRR